MKSRGEETIAACEGKCSGSSKRNKYSRGFKFSFEAVKNREEKRGRKQEMRKQNKKWENVYNNYKICVFLVRKNCTVRYQWILKSWWNGYFMGSHKKLRFTQEEIKNQEWHFLLSCILFSCITNLGLKLVWIQGKEWSPCPDPPKKTSILCGIPHHPV